MDDQGRSGDSDQRGVGPQAPVFPLPGKLNSRNLIVLGFLEDDTVARPRKQDALNIPERAVEAAIALLRTDGRDFALSAVARHVGCSAPALYSHFSGKNDLLAAVRAAVFRQRTQAKAARYAGPSDDPVGRLRAGGHDYVAFAEENPGLYRLLYAPNHAAGLAPAMIPEASLSALEAGVRAAQQQGGAAGRDARDVAELLWFSVHGAILMALDGQLPGPPAARWARAHRAVDTAIALLSVRAAGEGGAT